MPIETAFCFGHDQLFEGREMAALEELVPVEQIGPLLLGPGFGCPEYLTREAAMGKTTA